MNKIDELLTSLKGHPNNQEGMIQQQLIANGINDKNVIEAFRNIDRKIFVPNKMQILAYADQPVPIGFSQTISQPYMVAYMTQKLNLKPISNVLEIGTGCGYHSAILAKLSKQIFSIEVIPELIEIAKQNLKKADIHNVQIFNANGRDGLEEYADFTHIIVTAASKDIPNKLIQQLADNGKLLIPVGKNENRQELLLITKKGNKISKQSLLPVRFVPLV